MNRKKARGLIEIGEALVAQYAPGVTFEPRVLGRGQCSYQIFSYDGERSLIHWLVIDGLPTLLHEIAHHRFKHGMADRTVTFRERIVWETEVWLWSEKKCRAHGFPFDYEDAEGRFRAYFVKARKYQWVNINWRYAHVTQQVPEPFALNKR